MLNEKNKTTIWNHIEKFDTCMMSSIDGNIIRSRPMQQIQDDFDGILYFFNHKNSSKTHEIKQESQVNLSYQDDDSYVSLSGTASISHDQELIDQYWNPGIAAWFKEDKNSENVTLIAVNIHSGEYWDADANAMVKLFETIKANINDEETPDYGENRKIG